MYAAGLAGQEKKAHVKNGGSQEWVEPGRAESKGAWPWKDIGDDKGAGVYLWRHLVVGPGRAG